MVKRMFIGVSILLIFLGLIWALQYLALFDFLVPEDRRTTILSDVPTLSEFAQLNSSSTSAETISQKEITSVKLTVIAENLQVPWSIAFTDQSRILVAERPGDITEVVSGVVNETPLYSFKDVAQAGEIGLMGMVLDPKYQSNKLLYVCLGYSENGTLYDRVIALKDNGDTLSEERTLLDRIPAGSNHAGCELAIAPDSTLFITAGDATTKTIAQDLNSLGGKILRINLDGSIPEDNPFDNSAVYSYGHRNPQGIDWDLAGNLYSVEHGPSGNDGPGGGDELNLIISGANYGWPLVSHNETKTGTLAPLITYTPAVAPASLLVYQGQKYPELAGGLLFGLLRGQGIMQVIVSSLDPSEVISYQRVPGIDVGRVREIYQSDDGNIYFTTSNTDGRGNPKPGDDKIYQLEVFFK